MQYTISLRRSLCITLLVVVTASISSAQGYSQTDRALIEAIKVALQSIEQDTGTMITDVSGSKQTLDKIKLILDGLTRTVSTLREDTIEQTQYLDGFSTSLSSIIDQLRDLHQDLTTGGYDDSSVVNGIEALSSKLSAISSSLSQILSAIDGLDTVDSQTFLGGVADVVDAVDKLPDSSSIGSHFGDVLLAISQLERRLDEELTVTGQIDISGTSLTALEVNLRAFRNSFSQFYQDWRGFLGAEGISDYTWYGFVDSVRSFQYQVTSDLSSILSMLARVANLADYLTEAYPDYNNFYTNALGLYLPYLTNTPVFNYTTNIPFFTEVLPWVELLEGADWDYNKIGLPGVLGLLNARYYTSLRNLVDLPGSLEKQFSPGVYGAFYGRGQIPFTQFEEDVYGTVFEPYQDQRRWLYTISNTVPYIQGLPRHSQAVGDDDWMVSFGDLRWETVDGQNDIFLSLDGRTPDRTPWNRRYLATDYFADLFKYIARTNLLQDAAFYNAMLGLFGVTNAPSDIEDVEEPEDLEWTDPSDVQSIIDELPTAETILPTEFTSIESREYDTFASETYDRLRNAFDDPVSQVSDSIVLFPTVPSIRSYSSAVSSPQLLHFEDYMTSEDRRTIHDFFAIMWRLIYYVFAVWKITDLIKSFFAST